MAESVEEIYLDSVRKRFDGMKKVGDKTLEQLSLDDLLWQKNEETNSIAQIIKHLWGNMRSRWIDVLTTDGEKPDRHRDTEFELDDGIDQELIQQWWDEGWQSFSGALDGFTGEDLAKTIYIRKQGLSLLDGINRQLTHYSMHVGQIIHIAKECKGKDWKTLSIPRGQSEEFFRKTFNPKGD
jgi:hypothetical protein